MNEPEGEIELFYSHFTVISIDSLLVYENKYSLQEYLDSCDYKIVDKWMIDYLDGNLFQSE